MTLLKTLLSNLTETFHISLLSPNPSSEVGRLGGKMPVYKWINWYTERLKNSVDIIHRKLQS